MLRYRATIDGWPPSSSPGEPDDRTGSTISAQRLGGEPRGVGFRRTKSGKIIPPTPSWLGIYLLDEPEDSSGIVSG